LAGHKYIFGTLTDHLTGETLPDTHDERYRQTLGGFLTGKKGYHPRDIRPRVPLTVRVDGKRAVVRIDFIVSITDSINNHPAMIVKYGPGSILTRHRPSLSAARLIGNRQIPVVVVTNGEDADILDGESGKVIGSGLEAIPDRPTLAGIIDRGDYPVISEGRAEMESRILFAYEIDGACPCDDEVCRLPEDAP
jgi:hypothetical protein